MAIIGRLVHYSFDAVLLSTIFAGIRRSSGFAPDTSLIEDSTFRGVAEKFLGAGETIFDIVQMRAMSTSYFKRKE
ncbi:DUF1748-domain-containing protein [Cylindrobasidium torrendii FP15055 ss-10]|uniref:DUF1748-domain-containing protein n=1 Tax=Cylindrobasidium torrendii FP15055 ss-10 TaxID=1314674 RepID=A0A0D7B1Y2_9AGAR|nr:DUF1748-domain-containing protein [Cylindrobasidium torrendii FP15055 ss-10]